MRKWRARTPLRNILLWNEDWLELLFMIRRLYFNINVVERLGRTVYHFSWCLIIHMRVRVNDVWSLFYNSAKLVVE